MDSRWTINIRDNKTDETREYNTNAIFACIQEGKGCHSIFSTECSTAGIAALFLAVDALVHRTKVASPLAWMLAAKVHADMKKEGNAE